MVMICNAFIASLVRCSLENIRLFQTCLKPERSVERKTQTKQTSMQPGKWSSSINLLVAIHPGIPVLSSHREFVVEPQPTGCRNPSAHRRRPGTKKGAIRLGKQVENRDLTRKIMEKWHGDTIGISVGCDCCGYNYHGTSNHADKCNNVPGLTLRWKHMGFSTKYIKHWEYAHALFLKSALIPLFNMFLSHHLAQAHRRGRREGRSAGRPCSRPA